MYVYLQDCINKAEKRVNDIRKERMIRIQQYRINKKWDIYSPVPHAIHSSMEYWRNREVRSKLYTAIRKSLPSHHDCIRGMIHVYSFDELIEAASTLKRHCEEKRDIYIKNASISNQYADVVKLCERVIEVSSSL